jgi:hypothetical protein
MKKIAIILFTVFLASCKTGPERPPVTTKVIVEATYTNGERDTLECPWTSDIDDKPYCYISSGKGEACLLITSHSELGYTTIACGVRKFKELSRGLNNGEENN